MATAVLCSRAPNAMPMVPVSRMNAMKPASFGHVPAGGDAAAGGVSGQHDCLGGQERETGAD